MKEQELSLFEECLADYIRHWQETGKDPLKSVQQLKGDASELAQVLLDPIPCWNKIKEGGPFSFVNGLCKTPAGTVLVNNGYYIMLGELVGKLPREA